MKRPFQVILLSTLSRRALTTEQPPRQLEELHLSPRRLEELHLRSDADVRIQYIFHNTSIVQDFSGRPYNLGELLAGTDVFSQERYSIGLDGVTVTDMDTQVIFKVSTYKRAFLDGTKITCTVDDEDRVVDCDIISLDGTTTRVMHDEGSRYITFTADAYDMEYINSMFNLQDELMPEDGGLFGHRRALRGVKLQNVVDKRSLQSTCTWSEGTPNDRIIDCNNCFRTLDVGIVYDGDYCAAQGSHAEANQKISNIVARASVLYESDLCIRLNLVGMYSPDDCTSSGSYFSSFGRNNPCDSSAGTDLLRSFSNDMKAGKRQEWGFIIPGTDVHLFTGVSPSTGTIGCAWISTACRDDWNFGVNYPEWTDSEYFQGVLYAHEFGHNLNARHVDGDGYVMKGQITDPENGFASSNINNMLEYLSDNSCSYDQARPPTTLGGTIGGF